MPKKNDLCNELKEFNINILYIFLVKSTNI